MDDAAIARRHRVEPHRLVLALGLLAHRQRHPMQLLAAARAIRFGVEQDRHRIFDAARDDAIEDVFERVEGLAVAPDEQAGAVTLDVELERFAIALATM